ncbi:unnamed protein product [Acanthoscelides obtectus]|uniref:Uncharacterized protein n=1 Tax=Acanthoscelides obtectus TaxID=200917 RepID=A0A9P0L162_ACAOB|nr:unnamed protein product [Acanthoscelides obtectus]CAK1650474.1 hypothetical protein AOBTE_LOCUS16784 [Acanthoscelides obtectus]
MQLLEWIRCHPPDINNLFQVSRHFAILLRLLSGRRVHDLTLLRIDEGYFEQSEEQVSNLIVYCLDHLSLNRTEAKKLLALLIVRNSPHLFEEVGNCLFINEKSVNTVLSKKIDASLGQIKNEILAIKDELLNHAVKETNPPADPPRYSDVLRNRTQPAIVIRPKNTNQSVTQTKTDILKSVDPVEANIHLGKVCDIKEGGIVLGYKSKADNLKLLSIAKEKLGDSYVIKEVAGINPRVRIVGLSGEYSDEQIRSYLLKGNPDVFCGDVECKVLKTYAVKKNNIIFQSVLQIDTVSYVRVMKAGSDRKFSAVNLRKGGGVAVAVRSEYKSSAIDIYVCVPTFQPGQSKDRYFSN